MKNKLLDPYFRLNTMYKIIDKESKLVTFRMNEAQKIVWFLYLAFGNLFILKARQLGITTMFCLVRLDKALWLPNENIVITAHEQSKQQEIFQKVKIAYENLPNVIECDGMKLIKPKAKYNNVNQLSFEETNSSIKVALDSRSGTVSGLHLTEISFKKEFNEMMAATIPSLTPYGDSHKTIETTANGISGTGAAAYHLWNNCEELGDEAPYHPIFLPWYLDKGYELKIPKGYILPDEIEVYRKYINKGYKDMMKQDISKQQVDNKLYWYHKKKIALESAVSKEDQENGEGLKSMEQEYPTYAQEAFITTGTGVFYHSKIEELKEVGLYFDTDTIFPKLRIYREPQPCLFSIDTAGGSAKGDNFVIEGRNSNYELVVHFYAKCDSEVVLEVLHRLHDLGYTGIIAPEVNAESGGYFLKGLKSKILDKRQMKGFSIYKRTQKDDSTQNKKLKKYGWLTGGWNRDTILDNLVLKVNGDVVDEFDSRTISEMPHFIKNDNGRREAAKNKHDDGIITSAINLYILEFENLQLAHNVDSSKIRQALL